MEIHIQLAGIQLGPYSEKQVREYVSDGLLSMTDKAREAGSLQWIDVSELMAKLPPPPEPEPPPDPNAVFIDEEPVHQPFPAPAQGVPSQPNAAPMSVPAASPGGSRPAARGEEKKAPASAEDDSFTAKTKPLGPLAPTAAIHPAQGLTASKSVSITAPLTPATKKLSRTALARALQTKTEPLHGRPGAMPPTEVPAVFPAAPDTTGPMTSSVEEEVAPSPAPEGRKGIGLPSVLRSLTAKTAPLRKAPPAAPPVPGGSTMPVTTPLPTRAIINPAANRAKRPVNPPPARPPDSELEAPTEKLPASRKAAELRAKHAEKLSAPAAPPQAKPSTEAEPDPEPAEEKPPTPKRGWRLILFLFLALLALVAGAYVWMPYHAAGALRDAMQTGSAADLGRMVDFDSVRASLKQQLQTLAAARASSETMAMIDKSIDLYVTPTGISALMAKSSQFSPDDLSGTIAPDVAGAILSSFAGQPVRAQGLSSPTDFTVKTDQANLHLALQGLGWKLTRVDLGPGLSASAGEGGAPAVLVPVVETFLKRGEAEAANSDWKSAIADFSRVLAIAPQSGDAYNGRGAALEAQGDLDGAVKDFTQALAIDPQNARAYNGRGTARMANGDLDGAVADFTAAIKIDPTMAVAYDNRGNAKSARNNLDGAIQDFTQAIAIDPTLDRALSDRGLARQANGNLEGAIKDYTDALALKPKAPGRIYFNRGLVRLSQSNLRAAILDFDRAISFDPKLADAYFQRANAKSALRDTEGAITDFTQTLALNPKNALAYCGRGVAREDKGDLDGAQSDYTTALSLDPKISIAYFRRALIEVRKGDPDGAIADTSQSLDLDPKNTQAYYYRGFAKMVRGNLDGAQSDLRLFCDAAPRDRFADNARLYLWIIAKLQNAHIDADQELSDALENGWNNSATDFTAKTAAVLLGRVTEADYLTAASSTDASIDATQHCQAYYFAGMKRLLMGDKDTATDYFQKCVATGKKDFCEYILAQAQLQSRSVPVPTPAPVMAPPALVPATAVPPPASPAPAPKTP